MSERQIKMPPMIPVISSNVQAFGFSDDGMFVQFKNNTAYVYAGVPEVMFQDALKAESPGKFLSAEIKGKYESQKL